MPCLLPVFLQGGLRLKPALAGVGERSAFPVNRISIASVITIVVFFKLGFRP